MAEVQNPLPAEAVAGTAQSSGVDKDALITRLDALLEQYLHTLDEYEKLMQQLSKQLSSGFFSLTQANFHNRSGVHYGQDSYDERVQATRRITVTENEVSKLHFSTISVLSALPSHSEQSKEDDPQEQSENPEDSNVKGSEQNHPVNESQGKSKDEIEDDADASKAVPKDPIRMFGILVPPALRSAQASFSEAVDGAVISLAAVTGELRALEREIGRVRKGIRKA